MLYDKRPESQAASLPYSKVRPPNI